MAAQEYRFATKQIDASQAILHMPDKAQSGRTICSYFGSIVFREHAADDVFVDIGVDQKLRESYSNRVFSAVPDCDPGDPLVRDNAFFVCLFAAVSGLALVLALRKGAR